MNESDFVYRIEWVAGTQAIELWSGGKQLAQRIVSANAPKLTLDSPQGGSHRSSVHVSWTALDDDGDALTFALSVSPDGGETWDPLASTSPVTSYRALARQHAIGHQLPAEAPCDRRRQHDAGHLAAVHG